LFVGNLDFKATADDLAEFFGEHGYGSHVTSCKVITDWKTGTSKGYGFVSFVDPIFATSAMESLRNLKLKGRVVRLSQGGRRKKEAEVAFIHEDKRKDEELSGEELAIRSGMLEAAQEGEFERLGDDDNEDEDEDDEVELEEDEYDGDENAGGNKFQGFGQYMVNDKDGEDGDDDGKEDYPLLKW